MTAEEPKCSGHCYGEMMAGVAETGTESKGRGVCLEIGTM